MKPLVDTEQQSPINDRKKEKIGQHELSVTRCWFRCTHLKCKNTHTAEEQSRPKKQTLIVFTHIAKFWVCVRTCVSSLDGWHWADGYDVMPHTCTRPQSLQSQERDWLVFSLKWHWVKMEQEDVGGTHKLKKLIPNHMNDVHITWLYRCIYDLFGVLSKVKCYSIWLLTIQFTLFSSFKIIFNKFP